MLKNNRETKILTLLLAQIIINLFCAHYMIYSKQNNCIKHYPQNWVVVTYIINKNKIENDLVEFIRFFPKISL